jgi:hypothetical protein
MSFDQYHEPPEELSAETRTFARMITSLIEEAEAIGWYEQRLSLEKDRQARAIMKNAQHEEMKHFGMDLEFLLRKKPQWREVLEGILFTKGDIVKLGDEAEESLRRQGVRRALDALPERERRILELRFGFEGEPWTLEAIGHELDLTRERVRQLEGQALSRLAALRELASLAA